MNRIAYCAILTTLARGGVAASGKRFSHDLIGPRGARRRVTLPDMWNKKSKGREGRDWSELRPRPGFFIFPIFW